MAAAKPRRAAGKAKKKGVVVTREWLVDNGACMAGRAWFDDRYPGGKASLGSLLRALDPDEHPSWAWWLATRFPGGGFAWRIRAAVVYASEFGPSDKDLVARVAVLAPQGSFTERLAVLHRYRGQFSPSYYYDLAMAGGVEATFAQRRRAITESDLYNKAGWLFQLALVSPVGTLKQRLAACRDDSDRQKVMERHGNNRKAGKR